MLNTFININAHVHIEIHVVIEFVIQKQGSRITLTVGIKVNEIIKIK